MTSSLETSLMLSEYDFNPSPNAPTPTPIAAAAAPPSAINSTAAPIIPNSTAKPARSKGIVIISFVVKSFVVFA